MNAYIYLAKRDKKGMKLVTVMPTEKTILPTQFNPALLELPQVWRAELEKLIHSNRMSYEAWIETTGSYEELRQNLKGRGYSALPITPSMMMSLSKQMQTPQLNASKLPNQATMLRRKSHVRLNEI